MSDADLKLCRALAEAEGEQVSNSGEYVIHSKRRDIICPWPIERYLTDSAETLRMEDKLYKAGWRKCLTGDGVTYYFDAPDGVSWDHDQAPSAEVPIAVAEAYLAMLLEKEKDTQ